MNNNRAVVEEIREAIIATLLFFAVAKLYRSSANAIKKLIPRNILKKLKDRTFKTLPIKRRIFFPINLPLKNNLLNKDFWAAL